MVKQFRFLLPCIILLASCQSENHTGQTTVNTKENKLSDLSWFLGTWKMPTSDGNLYEEWTQTTDSLFIGRSFIINQKADTIFLESIRLLFARDTLYYMPRVTNQNEGKEIVFTEKNLTPDGVIFENPKHDFPQRIIYYRTSDSTMQAAIEGSVNNELKRSLFSYSKE